MTRFGSWLKHAYNVFSNQDPFAVSTQYYGQGSGARPDRVRFIIPNERTIISSIYTRMSVDAASVDIRHVRLDDENRYQEDIDSGLNNCLTVESNIDQSGRALIQDIVMTLFDNGVAAVVPVDTSLNPLDTGGYDILTLRVGTICQWYSQNVRISLYNEAIAQRQEITLPKSTVAIIENPLYAVMNERNSTLQRLLVKLGLLDAVDRASASGKLDLIIQLPYVIKSETRRQQAEQRRTDIEFQLTGSQYGIAYTDATEKITQLNRPAENNLMTQIEYLVEMLYGQLGITKEVLNGTATEAIMLNYWNRAIEPILAAITNEFKRKFLTKTARTQKQSVMFFKDPFRLVPVAALAEIADKFTRNEIMTSNEMRQVVGLKPHSSPKADQLINSNMPQGNATPTASDNSNSGNGNSTGAVKDALANAIPNQGSG